MPQRRRARHATILVLVGALALTACTAVDPEPDDVAVQVSDPSAPFTLIADADATGASVATSRALFDASPVVVVAPADDVGAQELSARAAVALGVPLLIAPGARSAPSSSSPPSSTPSSTAQQTGAADAAPALSAELERLAATTVLAVGDVPALAQEATGSAVAVERIEATAAALSAATGADIPETAADPALLVEGIAALDPPRAGASREGADPEPEADDDAQDDAQPAVVEAPLPAEPLTGTIALAVAAVEQLAPIATARAAGVPVHLMTEPALDPRASASVIDALHASATTSTLAIGAAFAAEPALEWQVRAARSGFQLPGGGQLLFDDRQFVALYGTPGSSVLGVLGEQDAAAAVQRARDVAAPYAELTDRTVVPMFEIIATVASAGPGDDGDYSNELAIDGMRPWVDAAAEAGVYVVLDLQPGRTDFLTQAKLYEELLRLPNVGLALDPEWRLEPDEVHLRQIGSVDAAEVNSVATWLADLTNEHGLPQKMLVLHQFRRDMITDRESLDLSRPELAVVVHVDGQGAPGAKHQTWAAMRRDAPDGLHWGWKNFYDEDLPMLTPAQTMAQVTPEPDLITYQ